MSSRRPFARTATDISLRPPQLQGSSSTEQAVATEFVNEHLRGTIADQYDFKSDPVHVVSYLTPHKVSVLILIEYYCQCRCPLPLVQKLLLFLLKCIQVNNTFPVLLSSSSLFNGFIDLYAYIAILFIGSFGISP